MRHDAGFRTVMVQGWRHLTFIHWRYPPEQIRPFLPPGLFAEMFDGSCWVSLTPFLLHLRPPFIPPLPYLSRFPETNCRTYVRTRDGLSGIWFFSLDAARALAVAGARFSYGLPYAWSSMQFSLDHDRVSYRSRRRWPDRVAQTSIEVVAGAPIAPTRLTDFLAERYRLFATRRGRLVSAPVRHAPWPLRDVEILRLEQTITDAAGLPGPSGPPIVHFSDGVQVRVGACRRC